MTNVEGKQESLWNSVDFDECDASSVSFAPDDRGVISGCKERRDDRGFPVVGRSEQRGLHSLQLRASPIIIKSECGAVAIMQLDGGVEEWISDAGVGQ